MASQVEPDDAETGRIRARVTLVRPEVILIDAPPSLPSGAVEVLLEAAEELAIGIRRQFDIIVDARDSPVPDSGERDAIARAFDSMPGLRRVYVIAEVRSMGMFVRMVNTTMRSPSLVEVGSLDEALDRIRTARRPERHAPKPFPLRTVMAGLVAIVLALSIGIGVRSLARGMQDDAHTRALVATETVDKIRYYDEVLSMTALMAATTGDTVWTQRYEDALPGLADALSTATQLTSENTAAQTSIQQVVSANDRLVALEQRALSLAGADRLEAALALLKSPEYLNEEVDYDEGLEATIQHLRTQAGDQQGTADASEALIIATSLLAIVIVLAIGVVIVLSVRRWAVDTANQANDIATELHELAMHDDLTGLHNRRALLDRLDEALLRAERSTQSLGLFLIDINSFKCINDRYGHATGDEVLVEVARRLLAGTRAVDTVARIGGDEFCVLTENVGSGEDLERARERIRESVNGPLATAAGTIEVRIAIGMALLDEARGIHDDSLLKAADGDMYRDKDRQQAASET